MGILLDMVKKIQKGKRFNQAYGLNNICEDKNCMCGSINIFKTKEPDIYTISIDCSEIFRSKEELYEYYYTLYKAFDKHFRQVTKIKDIVNHVCTYEGEKVSLSKHGDYYGLNETLRFSSTMVNCKDWFCGTLQNLYKECFN